ncbi:DUF3048 domain-containing protein [Streptacidiphilus monticola]
MRGREARVPVHAAAAAPDERRYVPHHRADAHHQPADRAGPSGGHVFAVKIDNVGAARFQQQGLNAADLVYVIQVEGGLSRYLAVYDSVHTDRSHVPARIGPVRSARQSDIPLLAAYGRVGLVYSGAISGLLKDLGRANLVNITPDRAPGLFSNGGSSPTYIQSDQVFARFPQLAAVKDIGLRFGPLTAGGAAAHSVSVQYPSASFTFRASGAKWTVTMDGHDARASADNLIIQHVHVVQGKYTDHNAGHPDNEVFSVTTGQGKADFYRDGKVWHGTWSKPTDTSPTTYAVNGRTFLLAPGRSWIVLDPR